MHPVWVYPKRVRLDRVFVELATAESFIQDICLTSNANMTTATVSVAKFREDAKCSSHLRQEPLSLTFFGLRPGDVVESMRLPLFVRG